MQNGAGVTKCLRDTEAVGLQTVREVCMTLITIMNRG